MKSFQNDGSSSQCKPIIVGFYLTSFRNGRGSFCRKMRPSFDHGDVSSPRGLMLVLNGQEMKISHSDRTSHLRQMNLGINSLTIYSKDERINFFHSSFRKKKRTIIMNQTPVVERRTHSSCTFWCTGWHPGKNFITKMIFPLQCHERCN